MVMLDWAGALAGAAAAEAAGAPLGGVAAGVDFELLSPQPTAASASAARATARVKLRCGAFAVGVMTNPLGSVLVVVPPLGAEAEEVLDAVAPEGVVLGVVRAGVLVAHRDVVDGANLRAL